MFDTFIAIKRFVPAACLSLIGLLMGTLAYFVFPGFDLEENVGLAWLFQQRGHVTAPSEVAVIAMDSKSAKKLGVSNDPKTWPRQLHAELITKLSSAGAEVIVFDVFFGDQRDPAQDNTLSEAIRQSGNVILVANMQRELVNLGTSDDESSMIVVDRMLSPAESFANAAWAVSPFVLPKVPARVNQFWSYYESTPNTPTLPARALERISFDALPALVTILRQASHPELSNFVDTFEKQHTTQNAFTTLRRFAQQNPQHAHDLIHAIETDASLTAETQQRLLALLSMYLHGGRYYLNFFGPPYTITTYRLNEIIDGPNQALPNLKGKVVFVGFSEKLQPQQRDSYYTVFTEDSGSDISGVEIGATAFSNLLQRNTIEPVTPTTYLAIIVLFSLLVAITAWWLPAITAIVAVVIQVAIYITLSAYFFNTSALWLPVIVPAFIQAPLILFSALVWQYVITNRERKRIRRAFGYYLPDNVVNDLARQDGHVTPTSQEMFGICLSTDAQNYTTLAENLDPKELGQLMNRYYEALFAPVRSNGGVISDVIGDAMLAIWAAKKTDAELRYRACKTALEIGQSVERFNSTANHPPLRTRIGLHAGQLMLGNIGALDHFEYRAVGDIVNTSSRIEELNKKLGSTILVSEDVLLDLDHFVTRQLGSFRLAGKQQPVVIHELLAFETERSSSLDGLCEDFQAARHAYESQQWEMAAVLFKTLLQKYPADAPSQFYYQLVCTQLNAPPSSWNPVISFSEK